MWEPEEQERFETAVVRAMTDENTRRTRLRAYALAQVVGTKRLVDAAQHVAASGIFPATWMRSIERSALPWRRLVVNGQKLRGQTLAVEALLTRYVADPTDRQADATLDWIDLRDLVAVAQDTINARIVAEVERRIQRRGRYQRGRASRLLGSRALEPGFLARGIHIPASP
jgi:hypothetical protein